MESQKKKIGQNQRKSPLSWKDRGRRGVKFVTLGDEIGDEENAKQRKLNFGDKENSKQGKLKVSGEENDKEGKAKGVRKKGRSVSPLPRSSTSQKDNKHLTDNANALTPASIETSKANDATKPLKKTQCQTDTSKTVKLAPVAKTIGLLRSPAKVTTAKSDASRQGSRRTSLTSTKKPKIKMKRSKTEDDNAEEEHQEEKRKDKTYHRYGDQKL